MYEKAHGPSSLLTRLSLRLDIRMSPWLTDSLPGYGFELEYLLQGRE